MYDYVGFMVDKVTLSPVLSTIVIAATAPNLFIILSTVRLNSLNTKGAIK
jgi:hypothetical protein